MFESHTLGYLVRGLLVDQLTQQFISEGEGSSRTLTRSDVSINRYEVARIFCVFQCLLEARITSGFLAVEDS